MQSNSFLFFSGSWPFLYISKGTKTFCSGVHISNFQETSEVHRPRFSALLALTVGPLEPFIIPDSGPWSELWVSLLYFMRPRHTWLRTRPGPDVARPRGYGFWPWGQASSHNIADFNCISYVYIILIDPMTTWVPSVFLVVNIRFETKLGTKIAVRKSLNSYYIKMPAQEFVVCIVLWFGLVPCHCCELVFCYWCV